MGQKPKEELGSSQLIDGAHSEEQGVAGSPARQTGHSDGDRSQVSVSGEAETNQVAEFVDRTKQASTSAYESANTTVAEVYDNASRTVSETYRRVKSYGREKPGTMTLIALGAGIGISLLLIGRGRSRRRTRQIVPPVIDALRNVVTTLLR